MAPITKTTGMDHPGSSDREAMEGNPTSGRQAETRRCLVSRTSADAAM
jgi:hypothetical protein